MKYQILKAAFVGAIACAVLSSSAVRLVHAQDSRKEVAMPSVSAGIEVAGQYVWVLDAETSKINRVAISSGDIDRALAINVTNARGVVFDGQRLWVADRREGALSAFNVETGATIKSIRLGEGPLAPCESIEDVAWDGDKLWVACYAGFSSTLNQVDPDTGRVTRSVFANCNPRGIASDGNKVWTICYNGEKFPAKIDVRSIVPDDREMQASRRFIFDIEGRTPLGLTQQDGQLWYGDRSTRTMYRIDLSDVGRGGK